MAGRGRWQQAAGAALLAVVDVVACSDRARPAATTLKAAPGCTLPSAAPGSVHDKTIKKGCARLLTRSFHSLTWPGSIGDVVPCQLCDVLNDEQLVGQHVCDVVNALQLPQVVPLGRAADQVSTAAAAAAAGRTL